MEEGETVKTLDGESHVEWFKMRPDPEPVYNLEVEGDHVYRVGESGVLVHNTSAPCNPCTPPGGFVRNEPFGTTNVNVTWYTGGSIARSNGAVALVTPDSIGASATREFDNNRGDPFWWEALTTAFPQVRNSPGQWERGHLIANLLGGPGGDTWWNMVPQHKRSNSPVMSKCEQKIADQAALGECIDVTATPTYGTRLVVPMFIKIVATSQQDPTFRIDVNIPNTATASHQC